LIRDRFERSGMRWTPPLAEAMLKLRAMKLLPAKSARLLNHATRRSLCAGKGAR